MPHGAFASPLAACNSEVQLGLKHMPNSLTLLHVPDVIYERLKASARIHGRSLNSEAIDCLKTALMPDWSAPVERLARARELRASLTQGTFPARVIEAMKRQGRP